MADRTGATSTTAERLVLGAGIISVKATSGGSFVKIGATQGGGSFENGIPLRDVEVDGLQGATKGLVFKDKGNPTLATTILEITKAQIQQLIPGSQLVGNVITSNGQIKATDYLAEVKWTGYRADSTEVIEIVLKNCLVKDPLSLGFVEEEATIPVTFTGHFDLDDSETTDGYLPEPWSITSIT